MVVDGIVYSRKNRFLGEDKNRGIGEFNLYEREYASIFIRG